MEAGNTTEVEEKTSEDRSPGLVLHNQNLHSRPAHILADFDILGYHLTDSGSAYLIAAVSLHTAAADSQEAYRPVLVGVRLPVDPLGCSPRCTP